MLGEGTYVYKLDKANLKKAEKELNEVPKETISQIETFRAWVKNQPHIKCRTDDHFLLRFLRSGKFSQLKAQEKLDNFLSVRYSPTKGVPDWFADMDPTSPKMDKLLDMGIQFPLPGTDDQGRTVILVRTGAFNPADQYYGDIMKIGFMTQDILLRDEAMQINGVSILLDFEEFSAAHVTMYTPDLLSKCMKCWQDVYPIRNKAISYYNTPSLFNAFYEVLKLFMKEKTKKRLHFHKGSKESLHKIVPKRMLPVEYGGTAGTVKELAKRWKEELIQNMEEFKLNGEKLDLDESKRPAKEEMDLGEWGLMGSFRKLTTY